MALPDLNSRATKPAGTGIHCSEHNFTSAPNDPRLMCPECATLFINGYMSAAMIDLLGADRYEQWIQSLKKQSAEAAEPKDRE